MTPYFQSNAKSATMTNVKLVKLIVLITSLPLDFTAYRLSCSTTLILTNATVQVKKFKFKNLKIIKR